MRRSIVAFVLVFALSGCGVDVKTQATEKPPAPLTVEPEVYDKVAPMPRAVERKLDK